MEDDGGVDEYFVVNSNQIKSATGNTGAFDPGNPDIRSSTATPSKGKPSYSIIEQFSKTLGVSKEQLKREYDAIVDRYKGTKQWMKAPNGKLTNLNERQWVLDV